MVSGVNGPGFGSKEEAARFHEARMWPRATNLQYTHAARTPEQIMREPLPPSPLDGPQHQPDPQPEVPQPPVDQKKTLKEIAMERGHIPRKGA